MIGSTPTSIAASSALLPSLRTSWRNRAMRSRDPASGALASDAAGATLVIGAMEAAVRPSALALSEVEVAACPSAGSELTDCVTDICALLAVVLAALNALDLVGE